jgi:hypothetical protein
MTLSRGSTLRDVALTVGASLKRHGISAVLTGGACASIHSGGAYSSLDLDFVLTGRVRQETLDEAMAAVGFTLDGDRFVHPGVKFWVEFPRGPLAIGGDYKIQPALVRGRRGQTQALSPTDSCRDRLGAFYHWHDRQSLEVAIRIAARNPVDLDVIRKWSHREGADEKFEEFLTHLGRRTAQTS